MPIRMEKNIKITIAIPFHWMDNWPFFLTRCLKSIEDQTFKDYEVVLTKVGSMPVTTNSVIKSAKGELIKILFMDDFLSHPDALQDIVSCFRGHWLFTATDNNPKPHYTEDIITGNNRLGSPSALTIKNEDPLLFDEELSWALDCDYYKRMHKRYGPPVIVEKVGVNMGLGPHQMTHLLTTEEKELEVRYILNKHEV